MISFKKFLIEGSIRVSEDELAVFGFGRLNPPTIGHGKLLDKIKHEGGDHHFVFLSHGKKKIEYDAQGFNKDPLMYKDKLQFVRKMFPGHNIMDEDEVNSPFATTEFLAGLGYKNIAIVAGSDRVPDYDNYLKKWATDNLQVNFHVINAGERDPDSCELECAASGSMARSYVASGDLSGLRSITPTTLDEPTFMKLFDKIKAGMGPQMIKVGGRWAPLENKTK